MAPMISMIMGWRMLGHGSTQKYKKYSGLNIAHTIPGSRDPGIWLRMATGSWGPGPEGLKGKGRYEQSDGHFCTKHVYLLLARSVSPFPAVFLDSSRRYWRAPVFCPRRYSLKRSAKKPICFMPHLYRIQPTHTTKSASTKEPVSATLSPSESDGPRLLQNSGRLKGRNRR